MIGLVKSAIWAYSFYFLYLQLFSISKILIFLEESLWDCAFVHGAARLKSACFANVAFAAFTGNATDSMCRLLGISFRPGFHEWTPISVCSFEYCHNVKTIPYALELVWIALRIGLGHTANWSFLFRRATTVLGIKKWMNESLGITHEMNTTTQFINCTKKILSLFTCWKLSV
jgi:hypothetical protein